MSSIRTILTLLCLVVTTACASETGPVADVAAHESELFLCGWEPGMTRLEWARNQILAANEEVDEGWSTGNVEQITQYTTHDVSFQDLFTRELDAGRDALGENIATFFSIVPPGTVTVEHELLSIQDIGAHRYHVDQRVTSTGLFAPDGTPLPPRVVMASTVWEFHGCDPRASVLRDYLVLE